MSLHKTLSATCFVALLAVCLNSLCLHAATTAKVGVSPKASALAVFANSCSETPVCSPDTVKSAEQIAIEAQSKKGIETAETVSDPDTLAAVLDTVRLRQLADSLAKQPIKVPEAVKAAFKPNPNKALWLSLVLPGAGQIYNRKYWKLPIIYGGFLGCAYALMWNQMMYRDYSQAYLDIMDDDPNTKSYMEMLPPRYDITGREDQFKSIFKRKKDYYRRYRDLSAFCFVGVYLISVIDAYVDAQLSEFDISPDLSLRVKPSVISAPSLLGSTSKNAYGVGCSLNF